MLTGPTARQGAVLRAAADGKTVYLYGGETANGPSHEQWIRERPQQQGTLVITSNDRAVELRRAQ
jgi:hypothetical protein